MAGLVPATHERRAFARHKKHKLMDGPNKSGHDGGV
jgi:hypothetical protein